jgi:hypothetical protein
MLLNFFKIYKSENIWYKSWICKFCLNQFSNLCMLYLLTLMSSEVVPVLVEVLRHRDVWRSGGIALTSALDRGEWSASRLGRLTPRK